MSEVYKALLAADMDFTLLAPGKDVPEGNKKAIKALKEAGRAGEARFNELLRFLGEAMNKAGETGEARLDELRIYLQEKKPELVNGFSSLLDSLIGLLEK